MKDNWIVVETGLLDNCRVCAEEFAIDWIIANCGFGVFHFVCEGDSWTVDDECMSLQTVAAVVKHFVDNGGEVPGVDLSDPEAFVAACNRVEYSPGAA